MAVVVLLKTAQATRRGWQSIGCKASGVQIQGHLNGAPICASSAYANSNFAPLGREVAVTSDHGMALLTRIAGL